MMAVQCAVPGSNVLLFHAVQYAVPGFRSVPLLQALNGYQLEREEEAQEKRREEGKKEEGCNADP